MVGNDFGGVFCVKIFMGEVLMLCGQMLIKFLGCLFELIINQNGSVDSFDMLMFVFVFVMFVDVIGKYCDFFWGCCDWIFIEEDIGVIYYLMNVKVLGELEENCYIGEIFGFLIGCVYSDYNWI